MVRAKPTARHVRTALDTATQDNLSRSEIPDVLINFVRQNGSSCEPPRKRQKMMVTNNTGSHGATQEKELDYIVVKECAWEIKCDGSKLKELDMPISRKEVKLAIASMKFGPPQYVDIVGDNNEHIYRAILPRDAKHLAHFVLALKVDRVSGSWSKKRCTIFTEFGVELFEKDHSDHIRITSTVKWNVTISPYEIPNFSIKPQIFSQILRTYFPDPNVTIADSWSPQDFYQSVHTTSREDESSDDLQVSELKTSLFPFQKRAVQWLLRREGVEWSASNRCVQASSARSEAELPVSFIKASDDRGQLCFISHLFGIVTLDPAPFKAEQDILGGILAEEMGLGKTVETIALITLHKRPVQPLKVFDIYTKQHLRPTNATLIVSPPSILPQWISEIKKHAPQLKIVHYEGTRAHEDISTEELLERLVTSDVVITTYAVLAAEIFYTPLNPEKSLRNAPKYPRLKSPLMQLSWWRVCIDEAQMIERAVSNSAVVARLIPRVNCWAITGTPVRKDVNDLLGLLIFLRSEPFASAKHVWLSLISSHKCEFRRLFGLLALRHSKRSVRDELRLPAQRRYVITMPFTPIEEQHYQELFTQMCEECGVDGEGVPLTDDWDPESKSEIMRKWLVGLRKTALHPEVGGKNRRAVGSKEGPLRTVHQVLETMIDNSDLTIRSDQRTMLMLKLRRGQLFENSPRVKEALAIWDEVANEASTIVDECREQVRQEIGRNAPDQVAGRAHQAASNIDDSNSDEQDDVDPSSRLGVVKNRLKAAIEVQHIAVFFRANAHYQIKSNEEMTNPSSVEFAELEKMEVDGYEKAKNLRREILQEIFGKADKLMQRIAHRASTNSFVEIPELPTNPPKGGLENRRLMEQLDALAAVLDAQANQLDEWREKTIQFLLRSLVDEDEDVEITGDEYEESTKTQDEAMVYIQALRTLVADRHELLTGQENKLVHHEIKMAQRMAKDGEGPFPEKTIALFRIRDQLKPSNGLGCVRGIVSELRTLSISLRLDAENGNSRAQNELAIVETQLTFTQKHLTEQTKATAALEKEVELFNSVLNMRLEYYRQLQQVSDTVAPYEGPNNDKVITKMLEDEDKLAGKVATAKSKRRYLEHLKNEVENPQESQRICVICREDFEIGALTVCGHQYCKECIKIWWHSHRNCPVCKRKLIQADLHEITYKPQELSIEAEEVNEVNQERASPVTKSRKSAIYSEISKSKLAAIKNIELEGPSFTTKIDTLARHLIWLRESDPGAKSIIFSQFKDFLEALALAFTKFRIGYSSIDHPNGIEKFKGDLGIECFLLHARAHSSGLNLTNASHVFLCEPLLNTALELQAIARVDRIGQHQETNVWLYLIDGTVEESIHQLSVKRRMEHIGQASSSQKGISRKGKSRELTPEELIDKNLEEANSLELQQASLNSLLAKGGKGGEKVETEYLWECLFGSTGSRTTNRPFSDRQLRLDQEVRRHIGAEAAEERRAGI